MAGSKARVLFICTGNAARSQMAEAFLRDGAGDYFEVYSAGLEPKPIHPMTYRVMGELGYDLEGHKAKDIRQYLGEVHFGYLITVCDQAAANCPIFPGLGQRLHWSLDDPAAAEGSEAERLAVFRGVRDEIQERVKAFVRQHAPEALDPAS
jgi:arsenate reductase